MKRREVGALMARYLGRNQSKNPHLLLASTREQCGPLLVYIIPRFNMVNLIDVIDDIHVMRRAGLFRDTATTDGTMLTSMSGTLT